MTEHKCPNCNKTFKRISSLNNHIDKNICKPINNKLTKPFLKWVGGKTQIIDTVIQQFPTEINNYHEIFLGGGSVLLALLSSIKQGLIHVSGNIYAYDVNEPLIYVYKNIQNNHESLFYEIQKLIEQHKSSDAISQPVDTNPSELKYNVLSKENHYYWIRKQYNNLSNEDKLTTLGSAMFIFLNKTCFRGMFRIGPNGFNVPYGNYDNPEIINKEHLDEIHELIQSVTFTSCDFSVSLTNVQENDYVYLDPPYAPENEKSFVKYTENGFNLDNHLLLFNSIHKLTNDNVKLMLSNADVSLVRDYFENNEKYSIISILCKRAINSKNPSAKAKEVLIKNY